MVKKKEENADVAEKSEEAKEEKSENKDSLLKKLDFIKLRENPWMVSTFVFVAVAIVLLFIAFSGGGITGNVVSGDDASNSLVDYLNSRTGGGVELVSYNDVGNLYEVKVSYQGEEIPVYITKDGKYFVQGAVPLTGEVIDEIPGEQETPQVVKSDNPKIELFVMTYCPYGTQAEKGLIPVLELLGSKIDGKIRFVHYFMHGDKEENETYNQACIREEQSSKFISYLRCFLEAGNGESCLTKTGIDKSKLTSCVSNKAKDYYAADSQLSQGYGVEGSPTLVINGKIVQSARSPSAYLSTVCSAFNEAPEECEEQLSAENPQPMWGWDSSGSSASDASCG